MTSRRDFLLHTSIGIGGTALAPRLRSILAPPRRRDRIEKVGLELYTVRSEMQRDVGATLRRVAGIGYREVEFAGYFGVPPERIREMLDANGLTSPSSHTAIELQEQDFDAQARIARVIGQEMLVVPSLNSRGFTDTAAWKAVAVRFNALGRKAHDAGLRFAFHNHAGEGTPMADGARPYDILLGETDPALVDFQMDLYWMVKSGGDPVAYFTAHPGRFRSVHVKDASAPPELAMRPVGAGTIDWKRIFARHETAGIRHYLVEHDNPGPDPYVSVTTSFDYLTRLTF